MTAMIDATRAARGDTAHRRWVQVRRHGLRREGLLVGAMITFALTSTVLVVLFPSTTPFSLLMLPLLIGVLFLGPRTLPYYAIFSMGCLAVAVSQQTQFTSRVLGAAGLQFLMAIIVMIVGFRRSRLGVTSQQGEAMLTDLRQRIQVHGDIPELPDSWMVKSALRSAGGSPFAGDFFLADRTGNRLELVLVDVSGKGEEAGTRALLLSGAFGGLLGVVEPGRFLPAANEYMIKLGWDEDFATAIHLHLDLDSGAFKMRSAGHPPAVHQSMSAGTWENLDSSGPALGLMDNAEFRTAEGILADGDSLMLYTDGMVENADLDMDLGIRLMSTAADEIGLRGWQHVAEQLANSIGSNDDDRALLVVHRNVAP